MKILLVDDDVSARFAYSHFLAGKGIGVLTAENGMEALELIRKHGVNIVVTDWQMPVMDGLELARELRSCSDLPSYVYIIMLTARSDEHVLVEGAKAGVDDFQFKPIRPEELYVRVHAAQSIVQLKDRNQTDQREQEHVHRTIRNELKLAAKVQMSLLPPHNKRGDGFDVDWLFRPCIYVGGDVFNCFSIGRNYIGFYQIDVAGHGVSSALLSVALHYQMTGKCLCSNSLADVSGVPLPPSEVIARLNREFQSLDVSQYFTMAYGYIERSTGRTCVSQAGHPPVLYMNAGGCLEDCNIRGFPAGMFPDVEYKDAEFFLKPGGRLFVYSDGVTECRNRNGVPFSEMRLKNILQDSSQLSVSDLRLTLQRHLSEWHLQSFDDSQSEDIEQHCDVIKARPLDDDISFMVIEYKH